MKNRSNIFIFCAFIAGRCFAGSLLEEIPPRIDFHREVMINFGSHKNNETLEHTFFIGNNGDKPLEIKNLKATIDNITATITTNSIDPDQEALINVTVKLHGLTGYQEQAVEFESNDPMNPHVPLRIVFTAEPTVTLKPGGARFFNLTPDSVQTSSVEIALYDQRAFSIAGITSSEPYLRIEANATNAADKQTVTITTQPPLPIGRLFANVHIKTDQSDIEDIEIPVIAMVTGDLFVEQPAIYLPQDSAEIVRRYVFIHPGHVTNYTVQSVEAPDPSIGVETFPMEGNSYRIRLTNLHGGPGLEGKSLRIITDVESMKEIHIPFRFDSEE